MNEATREKLVSDVLDVLGRARDGREFLSFIRKELRGWRGLGNLRDFAHTLESLGFSMIELEDGTTLVSL